MAVGAGAATDCDAESGDGDEDAAAATLFLHNIVRLIKVFFLLFLEIDVL